MFGAEKPTNQQTNKPTNKEYLRDSSERKASAAIAALVLAFSKTYWAQALSIEVYSLHLLLLSLVMWFFVRSVLENPGSNRLWFVFSFLLGLSFTNHMTTVLLVPGFLYLFFATHGFSRPSWIKISKAAVPFLIGLLFYLYLPLRASQHPLMNWGDIVSFDNFLKHVTGGQYHAQMFSSFEISKKQFGYFATSFPSEFGYAPQVFGLLGLWHLYRHLKRILIFSVLLFLGCLFYSINYDIPDIDSYFLLAYIATTIWIAYGVLAFLRYTENWAWRWAGWIFCVALVILPLFIHYPAVDERLDYAVEDYTKNVLVSLDSGAVILSSQWNSFTSAAYYFQQVESIRPDIVVLDYGLLEFPWYYAQLEQRYPWLTQNSRLEIETYLQRYSELRGAQMDASALALQGDAIHSILLHSLDTRHVYVTLELPSETLPGFQRASKGLVNQLFLDSTPALIPSKDFTFRPFPKNGLYAEDLEDIKSSYAMGYFNQAVFWGTRGDRERGIVFLRKSLALVPNFPVAMTLLGRLGETP